MAEIKGWIMRFLLPLVMGICLSFSFLGCGGSNRNDVLVVPTELPEICRGIDFSNQPDMREVCGVRSARYQSYKNIPMQRYLIVPNGASIVKKNADVELRLPNILPILLPSNVANGLVFDQDSRLTYIKNTMIYKELYPKNQDRIKMFKLGVPMEKGGIYELCFNLPEVKMDSRKRSKLGTDIEPLDCADFETIAARYEKK